MAVRLTRREYLSTSATALAATGFGRAEKKKSAAASIPPVEAVITGGEPRVDFEKYRKIVVSPDVNPPEPFHGFGGYCGWPTVCRLQNGDLFVTFSAGYWHASWPTPWDMPPEAWEGLRRPHREWLADWDAPEGGRMMWVRSRDQGKTWSRPRSFPVVPGAYYVGDVTQLSDGTMFAGIRLKPHWGYFNQMPTNAVEYARIAVNRQSKTLIFRSDDNGHTWKEVIRFVGLADMDAPYSVFEGKDGSLRIFSSAAPIPGGKGWPGEYPRWLMLLMSSGDRGRTWSTVSVIGSNDYDMDEGTAAYLPDGSLGFPCRPTSAWFQSYDDGRTWSPPRLLLTDPIIEDPNFGSEFLGPKLFRRGDVVATPDGVTAVVFGGRHKLSSDDPEVPNNGEVVYSRDNGKTWVKPAPGRGFKCDPKSYYPSACVLEDGSIFMVGQREGFKNRFGPHGAEVTSVRFRIKKPEEGEGVELLPIGGRS